MHEALIALVGVIIGFCLSMGYEEWKQLRNRKEIKAGLLEELRVNMRMVPQKRDIVQQIVSQLNHRRLLPGSSVRFLRTFYETYFSSVFAKLSIRERNSLHLLYEYFRTIDWLLETYGNRIMEVMGTERVNDYIRVYLAMMEDALNVLNLAEKLIAKHLEGHLEDVFYTEDEEYVKLIKPKYGGNA